MTAAKPPLPVWGDRRKGRVGILGGSFNPAHEGHCHISRIALARLKLDEVWWLVAPQNPLKPEAGMAPFGQRLALASEACGHPRIRATGIEAHLGTRYTADSLKGLKRRFPKVAFVWLMGADNLQQLPRWRKWTRLFATVPVAVLARPTYSLRALAGKAASRYARLRTRPGRLAKAALPAWCFLFAREHPASASAIREKHVRA
jgi:nicotinate-nucleotide adenylyltransferase